MIGRRRTYSLLSAAVAGLMAIGCSGGGDDKPREAVAGTVKLDGQPLPDGVILFAPAGGAAEAVASATGKIEDGKFSIPRDQGPVPGSYKVSISHTDQVEGRIKIDLKKAHKKGTGPKDAIPAIYNTQTKLKVDIPKGGKTDMEFTLQSK